MSQSSIPALPKPKSSLVSGTFLCLSAGQSRAHRDPISALGKPLRISGAQAPNMFYRDSNTYLLRFTRKIRDGACCTPRPHGAPWTTWPPLPTPTLGCFEDV